MHLHTIGVYGFSAATFFSTLEAAGIDAVWDVRQRRGVRGADYAFANATRLQARLAEVGVAYHHLEELAPSAELRRHLQDLDRQEGVAQRERASLPTTFTTRYRRDVLAPVDLATVIAGAGPADRPALLCVEAVAEGCHRSLAAAAIADALDLAVTHLSPPG